MDAQRQDRLLTELGDLAMDRARDLAKRAKAAVSDQDCAELSLAFERLARSVRMCLALEQRFERDRKRSEREQRDASRERLDHRRNQIKAAIRRKIGEEAGLAEGVRLNLRLTERLEQETLFETFANGHIEQHVARICRDLGLSFEEAADEAEPGAKSSEGGEAVIVDHEPHEPHERALIPAASDDSS